MKKPVALFLTDTHLKETNIDLVKSIWQQAILKCQELSINKIFFGGDFFTSRKSQSLAVLRAAQEILAMPKDNNLELYGIKGNHDAVDAESPESYLDVFEHHFTILAKEWTLIGVGGGLNVHLIPYFKEDSEVLREQLRLAITSAKKDIGNHILLTHIAVNGVKNNDASVVENDLTTDRFSSFHAVFVGHYHDPSRIGDNIFYIGSAYQSNYGENDQKGFTILYDDGTHELIQSSFPKYVKVKVDPTDDKQIKQLSKLHKDSPDHVRFVFEGDEAELKKVSKEKFADLGISVEFKKSSATPIESSELTSKAQSVSYSRSGIDEAFEVFCQTRHIEDNSVGKMYLTQI